jgi:serine/threonine protein kinase
MMSSEPETIEPGTMIAEFRVESLLGRGAMAAVYRAVQVSLDRPVALKVLPREFTSDSDFVERFFNEARSAAALSHANIVQAYDAGITEDNICYFAMEFVEGESLLDCVEREGAFKPAMALQVMSDIAQALDYGWKRQKLTHGDIKPANILINDRGVPKLADFGLAKVADFEFEGDGIMLTPLYAAPELIQGKQLKDHCGSDIYSFGATLYHLLVGQPPFPGDDPEVVMNRQVNEPLESAIDKNPQIPEIVSKFLDVLLAKTPEKRPGSWSEMVERINDLLEICVAKTSPAHATSARAPQQRLVTHRNVPNPVQMRHHRKKKRTWLLVVFMILLIIANLVGVWFLLHERGDETKEPGPAEPGREIKVREDAGAGAEAALAESSQDQAQIDSSRNPEDQAASSTVSAVLPEPVDLEHEAAVKQRFKEIFESPSDEPDAFAMAEDGGMAPETESITEDSESESSKEEVSLADPSPAQVQELGDDYISFIYRVGRFSYAPPFNLEPLVEDCRHWLLEHPFRSHEVRKVRFLLETVLPNLDRLPAMLIANGAQLNGMELPGFDRQVVDAVNSDGVRMVMHIDSLGEDSTGELKQLVAWSELRHPKYFYSMCRHLVKDPTIPGEEKLPCLSFLTLARAQKTIADAIQDLDGLPNRVLWRELSGDFAMAGRNQAALDLWAECKAAADRGEMVRASEMIGKLQSQPSVVRLRYATEIEELNARCSERVPSYRAGRLVTQALDALENNPRQVLDILGVVESRYGKLDFPEKQSVVPLHDKAVNKLAEIKDVEVREEVSGYWSCVPFAINVSYPRPHPTLVRWQLAKANPKTPDFAVNNDRVYTALGLFETGAWRSALPVLQFITPDAAGLPQHHRATLRFAQALVRRRFADADVSQAVAGIIEVSGRSHSTVVESIKELLALKLALLLDSEPFMPSLWQSPEKLTQDHNAHFVRPMLLAQFAYLVEGGDPERFREWVSKVSNNRQVREFSGFDPDEITALESVVSYLFNDNGGQLVFPHGESVHLGRDAYTRLLLAAILEKEGVSMEERLTQVSMLAAHCDTGTLLGADTWFRVLLLQIAQDLMNDRADDAVVRCVNALDDLSPNCVAYYPRIRLLEAALEMLDSRQGVAIETLQTIPLASVAAGWEIELAEFFARGDDGSLPVGGPDDGGKFGSTDFYKGLLNAAYGSCRSDHERAMAGVAAMCDLAVNPSQTMLADALQGVVDRRREGKTEYRP